MALRYRAEATNLVGITYRIDIYDSAYGGSTVIPFKVGGEIFELNYDGSNTDRLQYIIPSTLTFTYLVTDNDSEELIDNLPGSKEGRYLLEVTYLDTTYKPYWRGVLFADQIEVVDEAWPQQVKLTASDDLKALDNIPYKVDENTPYSGLASIGSHLINCINKLRWISLNSSTRTTLEDFFRSTQQATPVVTSATAIAIEHYGLQIHDENGTTKYRTTYEVLSEILALLGLRIFQVNGALMTQSIFAAEADTANAKHTVISSAAVGATSTVSRPTFTFGANYIKERGWVKSYLNPLSEVQRTYKFGNILPAVKATNGLGLPAAWDLEGDGGTAAILPVDFFVSGDIITLRAKMVMTWNANASLTGNNRLVRHRLALKVAINNLYLKRLASYTTGSSLPVAGETNAVVANFTYGNASWTATDTDRCEFVTPPLNMKQAGSFEMDVAITAPAFPSDPDTSNTGIAWIYGTTLRAVLSSGTLSTSYNSQFTTRLLTQPEIYTIDTVEFDGDSLLYRAINDDDNARAVLELPEAIIGDSLAIGGYNYLKALNGSSAWVPTETWYTDDDATTRTIHRLNCVEMLSGQNRVVPTQYGVLHERPSSTVPGIRMHHLLTDGSPVQYWGIFAYTYLAYTNSYDIQLWQLDRELTNISVPTPEPSGATNGPIGQPGATPVGLLEQLTQASSISDAAISSLDNDLADVSGLVNKLYATFQPVGDDYLSTKITYEESKLDGMSVELTQGQITMASTSGNTLMGLRESSPGTWDLYLQDDATPTPNSVLTMTATAAGGIGYVGINTETPTVPFEVTGGVKVTGSISVTGTVDGVDISALKTTVDSLSVGTGDTSNFWAFYLAD